MQRKTETAIPKLTKHQKPWKDEIAMLYAIAEREGLSIELRNPVAPEYQIARLTCDGVCIVVYPHTTRSTFNQHARVRDENSKDKEKAEAIMYRMDATAGFNCTFHKKWSVMAKRLAAHKEIENVARHTNRERGGKAYRD